MDETTKYWWDKGNILVGHDNYKMLMRHNKILLWEFFALVGQCSTYLPAPPSDTLVICGLYDKHVMIKSFYVAG